MFPRQLLAHAHRKRDQPFVQPVSKGHSHTGRSLRTVHRRSDPRIRFRRYAHQRSKVSSHRFTTHFRVRRKIGFANQTKIWAPFDNKAIAISRVLSLENLWKLVKTCENLWKLVKTCEKCYKHAQNSFKHWKTHKNAQRDGLTDRPTNQPTEWLIRKKSIKVSIFWEVGRKKWFPFFVWGAVGKLSWVSGRTWPVLRFIPKVVWTFLHVLA